MVKATMGKTRKASAERVTGHCLCGAVEIEIDVPARWAWHDHSAATRRAHGAAYATYVGSWRTRFRVTRGQAKVTRFRDEATGTARSFCARCGTPLLYERARSAHMVNIPRALFDRPHRPGAALSHRHPRAAGLDLARRTPGSAEGLSRRGVDAPGAQEAARADGPVLNARTSGAAQPRRIEGPQPPGRERRQVDLARLAVEDQLGHRLAGRRRVQHAPDAVARSPRRRRRRPAPRRSAAARPR